MVSHSIYSWDSEQKPACLRQFLEVRQMRFLHAAGFIGLLSCPVRSFVEEADDVVGHLELRLPVLGREQTGERGEDDCWCRGFRSPEHARTIALAIYTCAL